MNKFLNKHSASILTCCASVGVIFTAVLVAKETPKVLDILEDENDSLTTSNKVVAVASIYAPAIIMGSVTIACIFGANIMNKRQQALITSAYCFANQTFKDYRQKLIELYGEEADEKIQDELFAVRKSDYHQTHLDIPDTILEFYEPISKRYFNAYEREVMDAEYHLNRNYVLRGSVSLNEYYEFLGLKTEDESDDKIGWDIESGIYWLDFSHEKRLRPDGSTYYIVDIGFGPDVLEEYYY